ncbi:MAG: DUF3570 domain-containing protein [Fibrobacteria bacterium]|nr:DUF3570 domain-containing protein [Fibrobacteria bacterium]
MNKAEDVAVANLSKILAASLFPVLLLSCFAFSQSTLPNELQVNLNAYLDNANVQVVFPSIALKRKITSSTTLSGKYDVDIITAASMRSHFDIDGVSSATPANHGGRDNTPDDLRHDFSFGAAQELFGATADVNGIYSRERDYSSKTLTGGLSVPLAKKNTTPRLGIVKRWDKLFPQTREGTEDIDVLTIDAGITQLISKSALIEFNLSWSRYEGYLSNPYEVITLIENNTFRYAEPAHPGERNKLAIGSRTRFMITERTAIQAGYRFYQDDWDINSHTLRLLFNLYNGKKSILYTFKTRHYLQSKAEFFKEEYSGTEDYMAVDNKLNASFSNEFQFETRIIGSRLKRKIFGNADVYFGCTLYQRRLASRDWHSRSKNLIALMLNSGYRLNF